MPGMRVAPGRSRVRVAAGAARLGPAAAILEPSTSTDQPSCMAVPSKTRAGRRRKVSASAGAASTKPANSPAMARNAANAATLRVRTRESGRG